MTLRWNGPTSRVTPANIARLAHHVSRRSSPWPSLATNPSHHLLTTPNPLAALADITTMVGEGLQAIQAKIAQFEAFSPMGSPQAPAQAGAHSRTPDVAQPPPSASAFASQLASHRGKTKQGPKGNPLANSSQRDVLALLGQGTNTGGHTGTHGAGCPDCQGNPTIYADNVTLSPDGKLRATNPVANRQIQGANALASNPLAANALASNPLVAALSGGGASTLGNTGFALNPTDLNEIAALLGKQQAGLNPASPIGMPANPLAALMSAQAPASINVLPGEAVDDNTLRQQIMAIKQSPVGSHPTAPPRRSTRLPKGLANEANGSIPPAKLEKVGFGQHQLYKPAAQAFKRLEAAAERDGIRIGINSSYRTRDQQAALVKKYGLYSQGGRAASPGKSNHGWGLSIDLQLNSVAQRWMRENASKYGFVEDVAREPWHWTYKS